MKKAGDILKDLGFRDEAPNSLKEAFVRHLIESTTGYKVEPGPSEKKAQLQKKAAAKDQQLKFDFTSDFMTDIQTLDQKKSVSHKKTS